MVRLAGRPNKTLDVYRGRKTTTQQPVHAVNTTATESSYSWRRSKTCEKSSLSNQELSKKAARPDLTDYISSNQLLQLCTARTAWSESDQAVRTVHSCSSW